MLAELARRAAPTGYPLLVPRPTYKKHRSMSAFGGISGHSIGKESFPLMTYNRHGCFSHDDIS